MSIKKVRFLNIMQINIFKKYLMINRLKAILILGQ